MDELNLQLRTRIYIDGYNLYYGRLKGSKYKWLDLHKLFFDNVLPYVLIPGSTNKITSVATQSAVKYFTADISEKVAKAGDSVDSQRKYHTALKNHLKDNIEIIKGYYSIVKSHAKLVDPLDDSIPPKDCQTVKIWKIEEKRTDVNLALQAYHDAITGEIDHAVFVTNDTDIATSLEMIRKHTAVKIGVVIPRWDAREPNMELIQLAHWKRECINEDELKRSQLPRVILGKRKSSVKPLSWYAQPERLQSIIDEAKPVMPKVGELFKWLEKENPYLNNQKPIDMIESEDGYYNVLAYIRSYIKSKKQ
ncbi:6-hydroxy-3-succinoylpyridine hydroxylase [Saccharobesus litoralis]|uniref:6-hydroxy-3-succinoylpyridine hydroxylase n=1 Tax=Saccharobesus litoralis TaxID=2172099 RepID=A0A2S0VQZ6_9ALTE|nr:antitoxin Xre/MbcA/ParS toxin-binding domain-containing protein [Saccharobesus litoralis]AWB66602.1 6-hydroxy-3-succinoylpyridine hydroxylase [Saccharobesus litoralis]